MEQILRDLRHGFRQLLRAPVFTLISAVALGLGIGSVTTQISVTNGMFFKGLPYVDQDNLMSLRLIHAEREDFRDEVPILEYLEWEKAQSAFEGLFGFYNGTANLTLGKKVERYDGAFVSGNTFKMLGVEPLLGRNIQPEDDLPESPEVLVISHKIWERDFGGDPEILGREATLNGRSVTIVGVMPKGFAFPMAEDIWVPLQKQQDVAKISWGDEQISLMVMGRLAEGISADQASSAMSVISKNLEAAHPDILRGFRHIEVKPFLDHVYDKQTRTLTAVMLLITALILIIACANVANLLLARSIRRQKEFAIRAVLGATKSRILTQFLTESTLLAALGAIIGVVLSYYSTQELNNLRAELNAPYWIDFSIDGWVLFSVILITVITGITAGLIPAIRASGLRENEILKDDTRTSSSLRMGVLSKVLVVVQISVTAVILTMVILFIESVENATELDYEYNPDSVMSARMGLFNDVYPNAEARSTFINTLLARLRNHPEIIHASTSHRHEFLRAPTAAYELMNKAYPSTENREYARFQRVSDEFFQTVELPLLEGRYFYPEEFKPKEVQYVIVNEAFVEKEWPGQRAIGKRFKPVIKFPEVDGESLPSVEVIGVVGGMNESEIFHDGREDEAAFFVPQIEASMPNFITIVVRGRGNPTDLIPILREEVAALDKNLPLYSIGTPRELNERGMVNFVFFSEIFREFGMLAAFLAAVGIYGVISFTVNQRIMEFGIRQALGATRAAVFKLVYRHAFKQLGMGFLIALTFLSPLLLSPGLKESMVLFFYGIDDNSILPYLLSFGFVALIALIAAAPPAIRAARIHPAQALRYE